jgi:uncharacterized protein with LGFP repeats
MTAINDTYAALGGAHGFLGAAYNGEQACFDGRGRFRHYQGGSIYWSPETGAHEVHGAIQTEWQQLGSERSVVGYPTSHESGVADGRFNSFAQGGIYWHPRTGAHEVHGAIRARYLSDGGPEHSGYGFPIGDEEPVLRGRVSRFQRAEVFWDRRDAYVVYPAPC